MNFLKILLFLIIAVAVGYFIYFFIRLLSDETIREKIIPEARKIKIDMIRLYEDRADIEMTVVISNPVPVSLTIDSLSYRIFLAEEEIVNSTVPGRVEIKPNDTASTVLSFSVDDQKLLSIAERMEAAGKDSAEYRVKATLHDIPEFLGKDSLNFQFRKILPLIIPPQISVKKIDVEKIGLSSVNANIELEIVNKNAFSFGFDNITYMLKIGNNDWVKSSGESSFYAPAKGTERALFPLEVNPGEAAKAIFELFTKGEDVSYGFRMRANVISDLEMLEDSPVELEAGGKLQDLK